MKLKTCYLVLQTDRPVAEDATHLRGYVASLHPDRPILHHHAPALLYTYPRVQYRVVGGTPAILGIEELSDEDQKVVTRARRIQRFLSQPMFAAEDYTGNPGQFIPLDATLRGFRDILEGKGDDLPEQAFYMVGTMTDVREKARRLNAEGAE